MLLHSLPEQKVTHHYYLRVNGTPKYVPIQARCGKCVWLMEMELSVTVEQLAGHANTKDFRIEFKN
jgi:hypothetical protein